jgi:hypothetical protein
MGAAERHTPGKRLLGLHAALDRTRVRTYLTVR